jgi:hypothetical protein
MTKYIHRTHFNILDNRPSQASRAIRVPVATGVSGAANDDSPPLEMSFRCGTLSNTHPSCQGTESRIGPNLRRLRPFLGYFLALAKSEFGIFGRTLILTKKSSAVLWR